MIGGPENFARGPASPLVPGNRAAPEVTEKAAVVEVFCERWIEPPLMAQVATRSGIGASPALAKLGLADDLSVENPRVRVNNAASVRPLMKDSPKPNSFARHASAWASLFSADTDDSGTQIFFRLVSYVV